MNPRNNRKARFKIGDWVSFQMGAREEVAQVIEDRGLIGAKGRRLYRLQLPTDIEETESFELPELLLKPACRPVTSHDETAR